MVKAKPAAFDKDPLWYKDAVIYQLHVKSFFDSDNDGVGDFPGLISKLDYIVDMGVNCIWLLPFYPSPRRDDGYDIAEYRDVHPEYGKMADVRRLIQEAHARGIRVITELVINHTSDQHPWFQRARKAKKGSAHRDFYVWSDTDKAYAGTRIIFCDTEKSNWTWDEEAQAYFWHRFYSHQPDLNFDNPQVLKAVLSVMRFWLDLGIDGLRLDAIPYLIEREGTSNENLDETHDVLRAIRTELDATYPDRMLLAEANMWPEDTQAYFGRDGDECHMAFHFPLMPRMYMAIAQEDRFPITDIMRQTPEIPENCQWAIFLRNHDELTLEMVTDKERDYLWETYASDRRARINLGIRRRLAPLLERDRRRVELMNCLLLTMPGTPVLYYGDEIGMGDNIHLGDRDGVRTPMQWSSDRNGGFSRADPASLVLPAIQDPLYGYQAVNVEAQWRDPHSQLNWTRRMLAVRAQHQAFGRGQQRFLRPQNRKILAYYREHEGEVILCVANVSRSAQAVELDLSEFAGRIPVELSAGTPFPAIGRLTYLLTLPPYGFLWFLLSEEADAPAWSSATPGLGVEHHTFVLRSGLMDVVGGGSRDTLQKEILPEYIAQRRWFQSKDHEIADIRINAIDALPGSDGEALFVELDVNAGDTVDRYALPLAVAWEDEPNHPFEAPLALARVRRGRRVGLLTDAFASPMLAHALVRGLKTGAESALADGGRLVCRPTAAVTDLELPEDAEIEWPAAEQTNSTMIVGRQAVIKLFRRLTPGVHPEAEMNRALTERGFSGSPALLGEVIRYEADGTAWTVAIIQAYVQNQGDGWAWTLDQLRRVIDEGATPFGRDDASTFEPYAAFARTLGLRIGQMHAALASPDEDPAFAPETADKALTAAWADQARTEIGEALDLLARTELSHENRTLADAVIAERDLLTASVDRLLKDAVGAPSTRVHGDLHLGQVLVAGADVQIIDFEGEPRKTIAQRTAKASPLRDLAGVLRSFDYAAALASRTSLVAGGGDAEVRAQGLLQRFRQEARAALLEGYAEGGGDAVPPVNEGLLAVFTLEKAAYEIAYEAANRPDWIGVPLQGLADLTQQIKEGL
ncbi:MAG: maltose alpha-D-glucosyltransferase [Brevundimonas sp.]|uniref:maltose alpha-D-glucosyltransferase n=1 Tax=Brevundimonas sp. TaxID=1871086 RepID=UPI00391C61F1